MSAAIDSEWEFSYNINSAGRLPDGTLMCCVFNIGLDPIEQISLGPEKESTSVSFLTPDGERKDCTFHTENGQTVFDVPAYTLNPVILFLR